MTAELIEAASKSWRDRAVVYNLAACAPVQDLTVLFTSGLT
jgi:hypothetical protein